MYLYPFFQSISQELPLTVNGILKLCLYPLPALQHAAKHLDIILKSYSPFESFEGYCIEYAISQELYIDYDQYQLWCIALKVDPQSPKVDLTIQPHPTPTPIKPEPISATKEDIVKNANLTKDTIPPLNTPEYFAYIFAFKN